MQLDDLNSPEEMEAAANALSEYPESHFVGCGIVICAGGPKHLHCGWICIKMLRHVGCTLPIEVWHLGPEEIPEVVKRDLAGLNVTCVDAHEVRKQHPARILKGWEVKPYAIIHSRFNEALFLDADNVPVVNPEYLFEHPRYFETGAVFWPDRGILGADRPIWKLCGLEGRDEQEFESGQILVNKEKCWKALGLTMWMNEHSDFFYRHMHGDKETFHMAWAALGQPYVMCPKGNPFESHMSFLQVDPDGKRVFQHRSWHKWSLFGHNASQKPQFLYEDECLEYLAEYRALLASARDDGTIRSTLASLIGQAERFEPLLKCVKILKGIKNPVVVEIGAIRSDEERYRDGDGWATLAVAWAIDGKGGQLHTVDIDPKAIESSKRVLGTYAAGVQFHRADGVEFLRTFDRPIDLLYLDAWDFDGPGNAESEEKHLQCVQGVRHLPRYILIDDVLSTLDYSGKGRLAIPWLLSGSYQMAYCDHRQALLQRLDE